jgi:protein involved in polysaccharide export with SLBB domain
VGEVTTPSVLQLSTEMSIFEALTRAGGLNTSARTDNVLLIRGQLEEPELYTVDVASIYQQGTTDQMVYLQKGDIVVVPTRTITNVSRYFRDVQSVLAPFVGGSAVYRNVVSGGAQGTSSALD